MSLAEAKSTSILFLMWGALNRTPFPERNTSHWACRTASSRKLFARYKSGSLFLLEGIVTAYLPKTRITGAWLVVPNLNYWAFSKPNVTKRLESTLICSLETKGLLLIRIALKKAENRRIQSESYFKKAIQTEFNSD